MVVSTGLVVVVVTFSDLAVVVVVASALDEAVVVVVAGVVVISSPALTVSGETSVGAEYETDLYPPSASATIVSTSTQ